MTTTAPAPSPAAPTYSKQQRLFTIVGTLLGLLLAALDNTIVATAGPRIQTDLNIAAGLYAWITTAYLVASTVMIPIYGKLSDLYGRKVVLVFGVVLFLLGSALCGLSESATFLIVSRAIQGLGSAALFTSAFAIVADLYPPAERGRISGLFGAVFGLSSVLGPLVGGFITDHLSWHWAFFINLPVGAVALFFILTRMPALRHQYAKGEAKPQVDYAGAFWLVVGVVPLLLALSLGKGTVSTSSTGFLWGSWQILSLFGLALVGVVAFVLTERRAHDPILNLRLFKNTTFAVGNLSAFVVGMAFLGPIIFLPLFMVNVVGLSATNSGLTITPLSLGIVAGNILSGQLVSRLGRYKPLLLAGLAILMMAFAVMAFTLTVDATQASVTLKMVLLGLGLGPTIPLYTLAVQNSVEPRMTGVATSSATFFRSLGNVVGVAVLGTVFANVLSGGLDGVKDRALSELPASARAQFSAQSGGENGGGTFNAAQIKRDALAKLDTQEKDLTLALGQGDPAAFKRLLGNKDLPQDQRATLQKLADRGGFAGQKALFVKALDGDRAAIATLLADKDTPEQLRDVLQKGGVAAAVRAGFDDQKTLITKALRDNDPTSVQKLLASKTTPQQLREVLTAGGIEAKVKAGFADQKTLITKALRDNDPASVQKLLASDKTPAQLRDVLTSGGIAAKVKAGFADQKTLITKALRDNDPASVQKLLASSQTPAQLHDVLASGGIEAKVKVGFDGQKALITRALRDNDPQAVQTLLANPQTPAQLRTVLEKGGVAAQVKAAFDAQRALITAAVQNDDPQAIQKLLANPQTPAQLRTLLQSGGIKAAVDKGLNAQKALLTAAIASNNPQAVQKLLASDRTPAQLRDVLTSGGIAKQVQQGFAQAAEAATQAVQSGDPAVLAQAAQNPQLPQGLRKALAQIPEGAIATPEGQAGVLAQLKQNLAAQQTAATEAAKQQALKAALAGVDAARPAALQNARQQALAGILKGLDAAQGTATQTATQKAVQGALAGLAKAEPGAVQAAKTQAVAGAVKALDAAEPAAAQKATDSAVAGALKALDAAEPKAVQTAKASAVSGALKALNAAEPKAIRTARDTAVQNLNTNLDKAQRTAVQKATSALEDVKPKLVRAVDTFSGGFKTSLTDAITAVFKIGLIIVALGLLSTLFLPQLPLRKRGEGPAPAPVLD